MSCTKCYTCESCYKEQNKDIFGKLSSAGELAERYGVSEALIHKWHTFEETFPKPALKFGKGNKNYFDNEEVDHWVVNVRLTRNRTKNQKMLDTILRVNQA